MRHDRHAPSDIAALAKSARITAGGALPITERVQTSGRAEPSCDLLPGNATRAEAILCRGYADSRTRPLSLALWLAYGEGARSILEPLDLACVLVLDEATRCKRAAEWTRWGQGPSASAVTLHGIELAGYAAGWYVTASDEPGHAGRLGQLLTDADAAIAALARMKAHHSAALAARKAGKK